jgi:hypothetical protein
MQATMAHAGEQPCTVVDRFAGSALVLGGLVIGIANVFHPAEDLAGMLTPAWQSVHLLETAGLVLLMLGLFRLAGPLASAPLAMLALVLSTFGTMGFFFMTLFEGAVAPVIAHLEPARALLDDAGPLFSGPLGPIALAIEASFALGYLLLGIVLARSRAVPVLAGWLLVVAPLAAFSPPVPQLVQKVAVLVVCAGLVWMGAALFATRPAAGGR